MSFFILKTEDHQSLEQGINDPERAYFSINEILKTYFRFS
ncbi:hypothetical protein ACIRA0001_0653 [Acinetobacter radioresistens SK82]|uniref:Uncharacterized protein n=1 Tax=Acinetobacter radioresistens SK82 TaxID=596318 RepID=A0ABP2GJ86_ACIRA|nr:hypothetical protein ACIRA0001_0653 [Acinetobacter radioresistens SK82]EJO34859.1 hypothetical protein ACINWCA157_0436 [Acinetobacter radioresistens WC-A-157]EXB87227.1 hypothetical protein J538_0721 [Acinetobacter sp. 272263]EXE59145.1 hypothetical protein J579_1023 [Acinetobacter sp. 1239920]